MRENENRTVFRPVSWCAASLAFTVCLLGQPQTGTPVPRGVRPLALSQTQYRLRAGERTAIVAPQETIDFIRNAKARTVTINGVPRRGFVVGPNMRGDQVVLAASLTMKPGEYAVTVSAVGPAGEVRAAAVNVILDAMQPVPSNTTVPPVVLLNGYQFPSLLDLLTLDTCPVSTSSPPSSETFGSLQTQLIGAGAPMVYFFDNCVEDPNDYIENLGNVLGDVLNLIRYDNGALVPQVDLVAHSMGGLIVRSYLSGLQTNGTFSPPINPRVRKFIEIATPNFGSFYAAQANASFYSFALGTQGHEMVPGSPLLWNLARWNQGGDDLRGVDALAIVGDGLNWTGLSNESLATASDGVVSLTSASLGFARDLSRTRVLPYCHTSLFCGVGIAETQDTATIVVSFLQNTSEWMNYGTSLGDLSEYGGLYLAYQTATRQWQSDLTGVSFGGAPLADGEASSEIYYAEFVQPVTGALQFTSQSLGTFSCGSYTEPVGYYSAVRCKSGPIIESVTPLVTSAAGWVIQPGSITLNGVGFGEQCSTCGVWAYPGPVALPVSSWTNSTITTSLPANFSGFVQFLVDASSGSDVINGIAQAPPAISLSSGQLQFSYTDGGTSPPSQTITVANSGGGTFTWSASASASWITLSAATGVLTVGVNPATLSVGPHTGTITISAAGVPNSPQTITVTLIVTAPAPASPSIALSPNQANFAYAAGGLTPLPQSILISNAGGGTLSWSASSNASWLTATPSRDCSINPHAFD